MKLEVPKSFIDWSEVVSGCTLPLTLRQNITDMC